MAVENATVTVENNSGQTVEMSYPKGDGMIETLLNKQMRGEYRKVTVSDGPTDEDAENQIVAVQRRPRADAVLKVDENFPTEDPVITAAIGRNELDASAPEARAAAEDVELEGLRARATELGVDHRPTWQAKRLRDEIGKAEASKQG